MSTESPQFVLASASPRRAELLAGVGYRFKVTPSDIDESPQAMEPPDELVRRLAAQKAAVAAGGALPVLAADTLVVCAGEILGKPQARDEAMAMLARLSGRRHEVLTGVCVCTGERRLVDMSRTVVSFAPISPAQAAALWEQGECAGKAGAYGIQGLAEAFVERIEGSYSGVVGLPLQLSIKMLASFGVQAPRLSAA